MKKINSKKQLGKTESKTKKNIQKKIIIFGGSGFLAKNLSCRLIELGYKVIAISRKFPTIPKKHQKRWQNYQEVKKVIWDGLTIEDWQKELESSHAIVNMVGRSIDCIENAENNDDILRSRIDSIKLISQAIEKTKQKPNAWIQASAIAIYGDPLSVQCDEDSTHGYGFFPYVVKKWEEALEKFSPKKIRKVVFRIGIVLGLGGGALQKLVPIVKIGGGGTSGHGQQGMSWIHEDDMTKLFVTAIENKNMKGAYVASAPHPVSNKIFMKTLRKVMRIPIGIFAPAFVIRFMAKFILKTNADLVLLGRYCVSKRLKKEKFQFDYPQLENALKNLLRKKAKKETF